MFFYLFILVKTSSSSSSLFVRLSLRSIKCYEVFKSVFIERFHSRDYQPYWFTETKESICIKIKFNSQGFSLGHQHGCHFFVLGHQHGRRGVM